MSRGGRPRTEVDLQELRKLRAEGLSYRQISRRVDARAGKHRLHPSPTTVWRLLRATSGRQETSVDGERSKETRTAGLDQGKEPVQPASGEISDSSPSFNPDKDENRK